MNRVLLRAPESYRRLFGRECKGGYFMNIHDARVAVRQELAKHHDTMIEFLRQLIAIPSFDSQIGLVGDAVGARMTELGFDEVRRDAMGNILGRIGSGPRVLLYDSHIDTVGIADAAQWQ